MANEILYGIGAPVIETTDQTDNELIPVEPMEITVAGESESIRSQKFADGLLVTAGSVQISQQFTVNLGIQALDWNVLQFMYGRKAGVTTSFEIPRIRFQQVPLTAPFVIEDDDIISDTLIRATVKGGSPLALVSTAPNTGEFQPDAANNQFTVNADLAGKVVAYRVFETGANLPSIGIEDTAALNTFSLFAEMYNGNRDRYGLNVPTISRLGIPQIQINGSATQVNLEYEMIVPAGRVLPFGLLLLETA